MPEVKLPDVVFSWESVVYAVALIVAGVSLMLRQPHDKDSDSGIAAS